ncbi:MAG: hypothetical protein ACREEB_07615 [Caulobacteraceae bacterium]
MAVSTEVPPAVQAAVAWIGAGGAVAAAVVAAIVGTIGATLVTRSFQRERDRQDKESQWRSHAIELTKLDADRLMKRGEQTSEPVRPFILTFLANYRDLSELGELTPAALYEKIRKQRINTPTSEQRAEPAQTRADQPGGQPPSDQTPNTA